jgi:alpha-L-fucosidase
MKKLLYLTLILSFVGMFVTAQNILPVPSEKPNKYQKQQIKRQYGMFIHFGINTFCDEEWTDGSKPAKMYAPSAIDARQWVETAKKAGMKYIILVTKHVEGFCLWDSKYTDYDVASSGNTTNVVEAVAKECKRQGIRLGLYYSLWDRKQNADVDNELLDADYNKYMIRQLNELMDITDKYTKIVEFWFDSTWMKPSYRWPLQEIYNTVKKREPQCQITFNWTIGTPDVKGETRTELQSRQIPPEKQKEGDAIRYFPSDFRIGDPYLPNLSDPKHFTHDGRVYYMPWETTLCLRGKWFYNTADTDIKSVDELKRIYKRATAQDNILIIDVPPTRQGVMREKDRETLFELRESLKN